MLDVKKIIFEKEKSRSSNFKWINRVFTHDWAGKSCWSFFGPSHERRNFLLSALAAELDDIEDVRCVIVKGTNFPVVTRNSLITRLRECWWGENFVCDLGRQQILVDSSRFHVTRESHKFNLSRFVCYQSTFPHRSECGERGEREELDNSSNCAFLLYREAFQLSCTWERCWRARLDASGSYCAFY